MINETEATQEEKAEEAKAAIKALNYQLPFKYELSSPIKGTNDQGEEAIIQDTITFKNEINGNMVKMIPMRFFGADMADSTLETWYPIISGMTGESANKISKLAFKDAMGLQNIAMYFLVAGQVIG